MSVGFCSEEYEPECQSQPIYYHDVPEHLRHAAVQSARQLAVQSAARRGVARPAAHKAQSKPQLRKLPTLAPKRTSESGESTPASTPALSLVPKYSRTHFVPRLELPLDADFASQGDYATQVETVEPEADQVEADQVEADPAPEVLPEVLPLALTDTRTALIEAAFHAQIAFRAIGDVSACDVEELLRVDPYLCTLEGVIRKLRKRMRAARQGGAPQSLKLFEQDFDPYFDPYSEPDF